MANPYHDEEGRFCSRGEMLSAIDRVQKKEDYDGYFRLRTDFEAAEKDPDLSYENFKETAPIPIKKLADALEAYGLEKFVNTAEYEPTYIDGVGVASYVASYVGEDGGGIGDTDNIGFIFKINEHLYRLQGHYSSQDGTDWAWPNLNRVRQSTKTRKVFLYVPDAD